VIVARVKKIFQVVFRVFYGIVAGKRLATYETKS